MPSQTLEFTAATSLTLGCQLFPLGSDTPVASGNATEKINDKNRYKVIFNDVAAGEYRLNAFVGAVAGFANEIYDLTLETATFYPRGEIIHVTSVSSGAVQDIFSTYTISENYAPSGSNATPAQLLYFMQQTFSQFNISGVYISVKKLDGTTEAARFIMNNAQAPTSRTRIS